VPADGPIAARHCHPCRRGGNSGALPARLRRSLTELRQDQVIEDGGISHNLVGFDPVEALACLGDKTERRSRPPPEAVI
jgi:hypothetical protein